MLRAISIIPQNSPKRKTVPPRDSFSFIQEDTGRRDAAASRASLSFLSNGLEMYYYANVNFDTEFKKRLLDFSFFKKKKIPYVVIIASLFCNVNCNYAFCKGAGGEGRKGKEVALHPCSMVSVSMVSPPRAGREGE